jgi:hypothetical protein
MDAFVEHGRLLHLGDLEIANGQQRAARQQREAQTEEGEAETRTARVVFHSSTQQEWCRKETRIAERRLLRRLWLRRR